jgi:hypothetical protein
MRRFRTIHPDKPLFLIPLVLFVAVAVFVTTAPAWAVVIAGPHVCTYYKDAKFKTVVGARGEGCCGEVISWGTTSPYVRCERLYCLDVLCPS